MRITLLLACVVFSGSDSGARADDLDACQVRVVLFIPSDVAPPAKYQQRIDDIVDYAEAFFRREFERWGHKNTVMPFRRSRDGHVEVALIRGKQPTARYKPVTVRMEVMDLNRAQNKLPQGRQIWWILVYAGAPPAEFDGYLGGFGEQIGGWAVCNFNTAPGRIDPDSPLGSDFLEDLTLKGMIHELGHGLQLPHIGPLLRDNAGNTLMGPTHAHFRRNGGRDDRVYLSEAEAALLTNHPAFRGGADRPKPLPRVDVHGMEYTADVKAKMLVVRGRLVASQRANYAVVGDESDARPGEYWTKTYVGKVESDGQFRVVVTEPSESKGTLKTWFAFDGGAQTGDGKNRGRGSGISKAYTYGRGEWKFQ